MDNFREKQKLVASRLKCPCCNPFYYSKNRRRKINKTARAKTKTENRAVINNELQISLDC